LVSFNLVCKEKDATKANNSHLYFSLSSYVAAVGLPKPCRDHYVVMSRFARDCIHAFGRKVKDLEVSLGPDTAELGLRGKALILDFSHKCCMTA